MIPLSKTANPYLKEKSLRLTRPLFDRLTVSQIRGLAKIFGMRVSDAMDQDGKEFLWELMERERSKIPAPIEFGPSKPIVSEVPVETSPLEPVPEAEPISTDSEQPPLQSTLEAELARLQQENEDRKEILRLKEENKKLQQNQKRRERRKKSSAGIPLAKTASLDPFIEHANGKFTGLLVLSSGGRETIWNKFETAHKAVEFAREQTVGKGNDSVTLTLMWENQERGTFATVTYTSTSGSYLRKIDERYGKLAQKKTAARSFWDDDETIVPDAGPKSSKLEQGNLQDEISRLKGLGKTQEAVKSRPSRDTETVFGPVSMSVEVPTVADPEAVRKEALRAANQADQSLRKSCPDCKKLSLMTHVGGWYEGSVPLVRPDERPEMGFFASAPHIEINSEDEYRQLWLEPFKARLTELGYEVQEASGKKVDKWAGSEVPLMKAGKRKYEKNYTKKIKTPAGNTVRVYDEAHVKARQKKKEKKLKFLEKNMGKLRKKIKQDLKSDDAKTRATAAIVALIAETAIRVGNPDSADEADTFGATTLERRHAKVSGGKIRLHFDGKKGVEQNLVLEDAAAVKEIKALLEGKKKSDLIFEYEEGKSVSAKIVNRYLADENLTAKDLRARKANDIMLKNLKKHEWEEALEMTAEEVGHQASTLAKNYLAQELIEKHKPEKADKKNKSDDKKTKKKSSLGVPLLKAAGFFDDELAEDPNAPNPIPYERVLRSKEEIEDVPSWVKHDDNTPAAAFHDIGLGLGSFYWAPECPIPNPEKDCSWSNIIEQCFREAKTLFYPRSEDHSIPGLQEKIGLEKGMAYARGFLEGYLGEMVANAAPVNAQQWRQIEAEALAGIERFFKTKIASYANAVASQSSLRSSLPTSTAYTLTGADFDKPVYHAGKKPIKKINPEKLGDRDRGWFGAGFYVSLDPKYVKNYYGPIVSEFAIDPRARILVASIAADEAPEGLFEAVLKHDLALPTSKKGDHAYIEELLKKNQIEWVHAVDRFAETKKFDIVAFNDFEIVVKNVAMLKPPGKRKRKKADWVPMIKQAEEEAGAKVWGHNLGGWTFGEGTDYPPEAEYHQEDFPDIHSALIEAKRLIGPGKAVFVNTWKSEVGPKNGRVIRSWSSRDGEPLQEKRVRANPRATSTPVPWQGDFKNFIRDAGHIPFLKTAIAHEERPGYQPFMQLLSEYKHDSTMFNSLIKAPSKILMSAQANRRVRCEPKMDFLQPWQYSKWEVMLSNVSRADMERFLRPEFTQYFEIGTEGWTDSERGPEAFPAHTIFKFLPSEMVQELYDLVKARGDEIAEERQLRIDTGTVDVPDLAKGRKEVAEWEAAQKASEKATQIQTMVSGRGQVSAASRLGIPLGKTASIGKVAGRVSQLSSYVAPTERAKQPFEQQMEAAGMGSILDFNVWTNVGDIWVCINPRDFGDGSRSVDDGLELEVPLPPRELYKLVPELESNFSAYSTDSSTMFIWMNPEKIQKILDALKNRPVEKTAGAEPQPLEGVPDPDRPSVSIFCAPGMGKDRHYEFDTIDAAFKFAETKLQAGTAVLVHPGTFEQNEAGEKFSRYWVSRQGGAFEEVSKPAPRWSLKSPELFRPLWNKTARMTLTEEQQERIVALEKAVDDVLGAEPAAARSKTVAPVGVPQAGQQPAAQGDRPGKPPISSDYGDRKDPRGSGKTVFHKGLDIAVPKGTAVLAIQDGRVIRAGWENDDDHLQGYGLRVYIEHDSGQVSRYAHLSELAVKVGDDVVKGQKIGLSGASGNATRGGREFPHLHLELRDKDNNHLDPEAAIYGKGAN